MIGVAQRKKAVRRSKRRSPLFLSARRVRDAPVRSSGELILPRRQGTLFRMNSYPGPLHRIILRTSAEVQESLQVVATQGLFLSLTFCRSPLRSAYSRDF